MAFWRAKKLPRRPPSPRDGVRRAIGDAGAAVPWVAAVADEMGRLVGGWARILPLRRGTTIVIPVPSSSSWIAGGAMSASPGNASSTPVGDKRDSATVKGKS